MSERAPEGRLFEWYHEYIGEPDSDIDVYLGFALFFGAIGLAGAAFVVWAGSQAVVTTGYLGREIAFSLGLAALPMALLSIVVLLPVDRRSLYGALAGSAVCLAGTAGFVWAYPYSWATGPGPQYSVPVLFVYGVGVAGMLGSTGSALVAYHIERARPTPGDFQPEETTAEDEDDGESWSEAEIQSDIDEAMENVDITWGGVERHEGTDLTLTTDFGDDIDTSGMAAAAETVHREAVDDQVAGLKGLKGGDKKTARSTSTVDDQTAQLQDLKQRRQEETDSAADGTDDGTVLGSVLDGLAKTVGRR